MARDRIVAAAQMTAEDESKFADLRPKRLDEYIGQRKNVELLKISLGAAKKRGEPLDHVLFHGPPGLGKTTLAHVIAAEMGKNIRMTSGPAITRPSGRVAASGASARDPGPNSGANCGSK